MMQQVHHFLFKMHTGITEVRRNGCKVCRDALNWCDQTLGTDPTNLIFSYLIKTQSELVYIYPKTGETPFYGRDVAFVLDIAHPPGKRTHCYVAMSPNIKRRRRPETVH